MKYGKKIPNRLTTLGHPHRLALFRLLMRRYPDRLPAGEIALALEVKSSTLSSYLAVLQKVGLITQKRAGTTLLYSVEMSAVRETFDYLLLDCCRGRPDICSPVSFAMTSNHALGKDRKFNLLFICTGNSARSIFAECILRDLAGDRFDVFSAGTKPSSEPNPFAVRVLKSKGHDIATLRAKTVAEVATPDAPTFDFVFTVCDQAANEECPAWDGQPISGHWGMPDPVKARGTDAERSLAFQQAYGALHRRISAFAALPIAALDRVSLQSAVDHIAHDDGST